MNERNREFKDAAYFAYAKALRDGLLVRPDSCAKCGRVTVVDGHHEDYLRPFDVQWLCRSCHFREHRVEIHELCQSRPRCLGCDRIIYKHLLKSAKHVRPFEGGYIHNACVRKARARLAKYLGAERVA